MKPRRSDRLPPQRSRGVALIAVLWVVLLLAMIAGSLTMLTRTELGLSRNLVLSARAEALAEGGIHLAAARLLSPADAGSPGILSWQVQVEEGVVEISTADIGGRIDLNAAQPELIAGLLRAAGAGDMADGLADRIVDWRDADDNPRPDGAEQADYAGYEPPVHVGNAPFLTSDEILRIPGISMDLWQRIEGAVTVHSRRPGVNPLYAPKLALLALPGMDEAAADELIASREQINIDTGTNDKPVTQRVRISDALQFLPQEARRYLAGGMSKVYVVRARARLAEGAVYAIEAVIELTPGNDPPWRTHEWRPASAE